MKIIVTKKELADLVRRCERCVCTECILRAYCGSWKKPPEPLDCIENYCEVCEEEND